MAQHEVETPLPPTSSAVAAPVVQEPAHTNAAAQIEAEDVHSSSDTDSAFGDDSRSYTTSLKSSVLNYKYENGRRYHAEGDQQYFLPNDESELDRLDLYHHVCTLRTDGRLYTAPIGDSPQRILDIGTGTGIWAIEMGDHFPSAQVIGNDLSPVQPQVVPPNVTFEVDDVEAPWTYTTPFDYIHCRYMAGSIKSWPSLMAQAFAHTKPGGWVEFQDFEMRWYTHSGTFAPGCPLDKWCLEIIEGLHSIGQEPEPGPKLKGWVEEAGFVNVKHELLPIPTGTWPKDRKLKEIGAYDMVQFLDGLEGLSVRTLTGLRGYTVDEVYVLLAELRRDLNDKRLQVQHNFHVVYAQKPLE